ncbi:DUF1566 domain-containing protein [Roseateles sp.]|uniref:DUF1566 domain-containing protein n=1 Tax=Roseateles sp. TaxID=1971397 RepID=UPI002F425FD2
MTLDQHTVSPIQFCDIPQFLPPIGSEFGGGIFAGITTTKAGTYSAVVLLPGEAQLDWEDAKAWAAARGGEVPTRPVAALLYTTLKHEFQPRWYWTSDELSNDTGDADDASYAWYCGFSYGDQDLTRKSYEGCVRAVRLIPLIA